MKEVLLCDKTVRVDDNGMICLTDMWKASGQLDENQPSHFLRNSKTKAYIRALEAKLQKCSLKKIRGGNNAGTWAEKLLAYDYAGWIDPKFKIGTYTVLDKFFNRELLLPQQELHEHTLRDAISKEWGSYHGKGLSLRRWQKIQLEREKALLLKKYQFEFELELLKF